jgi:hypothetical protein
MAHRLKQPGWSSTRTGTRISMATTVILRQGARTVTIIQVLVGGHYLSENQWLCQDIE